MSEWTEEQLTRWIYKNRPTIVGRWMRDFERRNPYCTLDAHWERSDNLQIGDRVILKSGDESTYKEAYGVDNRNRSVLLEVGNPRVRRWISMANLEYCGQTYTSKFQLDKRLPDSARICMLENKLRVMGRRYD